MFREVSLNKNVKNNNGEVRDVSFLMHEEEEGIITSTTSGGTSLNRSLSSSIDFASLSILKAPRNFDSSGKYLHKYGYYFGNSSGRKSESSSSGNNTTIPTLL